MDYTTNLNRFIEAQNSPGFAGYNNAIEEIRRGKKLSHWIWYVFPQLKSISQNSPYDKKYGIENLDEAKAYLKNSILRKRLDDVCEILLKHEGKTASSIFGVADSSRIRSSMTLFYLASNNELYKQVLDKYYNGRPCQNTLYTLNMKMPESASLSKTGNNRKQESPKERRRQPFTTKPQQFVSTARLKSLRRRKMRKVAILIVGFIGIIALFGGMGYGVYTLFTGNDEEPMVAESSQELSDSPNVNLQLNVAVMTSDQETITFGDKDKYSMSLMASMGSSPVQLDSSTSKFNFLYNNENSSEEIKIDAKVETCQIGGQTFSISNYDVKEGSYDETFNLDVSREDLRIYEELAWYQSANQKVSSDKYKKYVDRIKKVQNQEFAALLTQKLSFVGKSQEVQKKDEVKIKKDEPKKKDSDILPVSIREHVSRAKMIPSSLMNNQSDSERHILISYNKWLSMTFNQKDGVQQHELRRLLERCSTYRDLKITMRKYDER